MTETVAILGGTGNLGFGVAVRLGKAGLRVVIGSRDPERGRAAADRATKLVDGGQFRGAGNGEAAAAADRLIILSVPFSSQAVTLKSVAGNLREGQVLLDATVPLAPAVGGKPTQLIGVWQGSAAQQARALVPAGIGVVSGLHTISAAVLEDLEIPLEQDTFLCGDKATDKAVAADVLSNIEGLRVVDAGRLEMSRLVEGLTPLLIGINARNKVHAGIRVVGLP